MAGISGPLSAQGASGTGPDDLYLKAYSTWGEAKKLKEAGKLNEAHEKYVRASSDYDVVASTWPAWEPQLIQYRREQIRKEMAAVIARLSSAGVAPVAAANPILPPLQTTPQGSGLAPITPPTRSGGNLTDFAKDLQRKQNEYEAKILAAQREAIEARQTLEQTQSRYQLAIQEIADTKEQARLITEEKSALERLISAKDQELGAKDAEQAKVLATTRDEIAILRAREEKALQEVEAASKRSAEHLTKISDLDKILADVKEEREELLKQRDEMEALLDSKGSTETEARLTEENRRLRARLADTLKEVATLKKEGRTKDVKIASLEKQVLDLNRQLSTLQEENEAYQARIEDLSQRLRETGRTIITDSGTVVDPLLIEENRILKGVISRQIKKLSARKQRGRLLAEQLRQSDLENQDLIVELEDLVDHRIVLTAEEKALFRGSELDNLAQGNGEMSLVAEEKTNFEGQIATMPPPELLTNAANHFAEGDYARTELLFTRYLKVGEEKKAGAVLANLGVVQMRMKKFEASEQSLKEALLQSPDDAFPHFNLGFNYLWQNRAQDARLNLESSTRLDPKNPKARFYLGVALARTEDYDRARDEFQEAIAIQPTYGDAHYNLSLIHLLDGDEGLEKAREHYLKAIECGIPADERIESKLGPKSAALP